MFGHGMKQGPGFLWELVQSVIIHIIVNFKAYVSASSVCASYFEIV